MHATFQGHISAFLTKDEYRPTVEKLEDLRDSRYTAIYVTSGLAAFIDDPVLREKLVVHDPDCSFRVIGNDSVTCIVDIVFLLKSAFENHFHMSNNPIRESVYYYVTQDEDNWPLKKRFDTFLMWVEQSGIIRKWVNNDGLENAIASQKRIATMSEIHHRPISLAMLEFIFIIYGFGILLAIISFGFEMWIKSSLFKKRQDKRRLNFWFLQNKMRRVGVTQNPFQNRLNKITVTVKIFRVK
ncbi:hypothetical protein PV327_008108 [Microctonus hyperodae]|uniref:Uncharacterized protein n=1 Tax=Microctonus hyperodae TaxID=165561 RepID=A0AA39F2F3_MICHY|nr:hypothetical protein PV327_008108 [Microctonus hyperodae]